MAKKKVSVCWTFVIDADMSKLAYTSKKSAQLAADRAYKKAILDSPYLITYDKDSLVHLCKFHLRG